MRNVLLFLTITALALPAFAKEIEIGPYVVEDVGGGSGIYAPYDGANTRTEHDLINDDGSYTYMFSGPTGMASTFDIGSFVGSDCWLTEMSVYAYTYSQTYDVKLNCFGWNATYSRPDENDSYFGGDVTFPGSGPYNYEWATFDVSDEHAYFENGDKVTLLTYGGTYPFYLMLDGNGSAPQYSGWFWFGGSSWTDYSAYGYGAAMIRGVVNDDVDGPYVDEQDPPDGGAGAPDTDIVFHCKDDDFGVDSDTIDFTAYDETRGEVSGSLDIDDSDANDVVCTFTPDADLEEGTINCTVAGTLADGLTNEMGDDAVWSFVADGTPPTITQTFPGGGRTGGGATVTRSTVGGGATVVKSIVHDSYTRTAGPDTNIGWHIEDNAAGCLFADCVYSVKVGGSDVPVSENVTDDGTTDVTVELDPNSDFNPGDVVDVSVQATDMAGNEMDAPYEWSFTVGAVNVDEASLGEIKATYR
jgi:hypothetical protein